MKKKLIFFVLLALIGSTSMYAQNVGINSTGADPNASAALDIDASDKGLLVPRVALTGTTDASTIASGNVNSLLVYNTATIADVTPGFYYWNASLWERVTSGSELTGLGDDDFWKDSLYIRGTDTLMVVKDNGKVGIGAVVLNSLIPSKLEVNGSTLSKYATKTYRVNGSAAIEAFRLNGTLESPTQVLANQPILYLPAYSMNSSGGWNYNGGVTVYASEDQTTTSKGSYISFFTQENAGGGVATRMRISDNGNVGIGTTSPTSKLEVAGQVKITGGTPGIGKVLTSDADGLASWEVASTNDDDFWKDSLYIRGTDTLMIIKDNGNVGVGTTNPESVLDIRKTAIIPNDGYIKHNVARESSYGGGFHFRRSRGTIDLPTAIQDADVLTYQSFSGYDGTAYSQAATLFVQVDGTPSSGSIPGAFKFSTRKEGESTTVTRMVIKNDGKIGVGTISPTEMLTVNGSLEILESGYLILPGFQNPGDLAVDFSGGYQIFSDNVGSGANNTRLWINTPDEGEFIVGPRAGAHYLDNMRLRTNIFTVETNASNNTLVATESGNVGIGTTSPQSKLHTVGEKGLVVGRGDQTYFQGGDITNQTLHLYDGEQDGEPMILFAQFNSMHNAGQNIVTSNPYIKAIRPSISNYDMDLSIGIGGGSSTPNEVIRVKSDGNVGIGTSSPTSKLQVVGLPEYADNAAAIAGGLTIGAFYRTGDLLKVVH